MRKKKDLLFKYLCLSLPYGTKVKIKYHDGVWKLLAIYTNGTTYATRDVGYPIETYFEDCKPYLLPLSSMTEEQKNAAPFESSLLNAFINGYISLFEDEELTIDDLNRLYDWLNKNHFDYRGLIPMGLAIDATNLNIY